MALSAVCAVVSAQNVNPTVHVTNDYRTSMAEVPKLGVTMNVPDSLYEFDYKFNYSVFESPYKGAYEFSPYAVHMEPTSQEISNNTFYLRAGAGYTLHPELELVFSPVPKGDKVGISLFADASGYYGPYAMTDRKGMLTGDNFTGYDFGDNAGLEGSVCFNKARLTLGAGHNGIFTSSYEPYSEKASSGTSIFNAVYGRARITSTTDSGSFLYYDAGLQLRHGTDRYSGSGSLTETDFVASGTIGPVLQTRYRFLVDARMELAKQNGVLGGMTEHLMTIVPHVQFELGQFNLSAGVRVDHSNAFHLAPDVHAEIGLGKRVCTIYADVTGGDELNTYYSLKSANHRLKANYLTLPEDKFTPSRTLLAGRLGFRGNAGAHFQYNISGGYGSYASNPFDCIVDIMALDRFETAGAAGEGICYLDYKALFANLELAWRSERFDADASAGFIKTDIASTETVRAFDKPALNGNVRLRYNIKRRIFFGVTACGETSRTCLLHGNGMELPGFIDLGVFGEYKFGQHFSFWLRGGNLLCQPVRKSLMYVEKSPFATLGITLSL